MSDKTSDTDPRLFDKNYEMQLQEEQRQAQNAASAIPITDVLVGSDTPPDVLFAMRVAQGIVKEKLAKGSKLSLPVPLTQMLMRESIADLIAQCGRTARGHGFWDAHVNQALKLLGLDRKTYDGVCALAAGDVANVRRKAGADISSDDFAMHKAVVVLEQNELLGDPTIFLALVLTEGAEAIEAVRASNWANPSGVWEELADTFIRLFDFIARYGPKHEMTPQRFLAMIQAKMAVNEARPALHGKNF